MKKFFILIVIISLSFSCKIKQNRQIKYEMIAKSQLYDSIINANSIYNSLLLKFNVKFEHQKEKVSFKGIAKIRKDSVIIISFFAMLNIEAVKLKFTKDSLIIINRLQSNVKAGSYKYLKKAFNINFNYNDLQSILTNSFFVYPHTKSEKSEFVNIFNFTKDTTNISIYRKLPNSGENVIKLNKNNFKISDYLISYITENRFIKLQYINNYSDEFNELPKKVNISHKSKNKLTSINITYKKIYKNKKLRYTFNIPKNYEIMKYE